MGRSKRIRLGRKGWQLVLWILVITGPISYLWYRGQDRPTQETAEAIVLSAIDFLREWERTPIEVVWTLDALADYIPLSRGQVINVAVFDQDTRFVYGGMPRGNEGLVILENLGYLVGYDERKKNPGWVAYRLTKSESLEAPERPEGFRVDERTRSRTKTNDYTGSGFDRGHLAPNYAIGLLYGKAAQEETFLMSNVVPQRPELNRGIWKDLEQREARRWGQRLESVWVICGPIYEKGSGQRLKGGEVVPDRFFKIVVDEIDGGIRALAFIFPQEVKEGSEMEAFLVSIDLIEMETGLDFFAILPDESEDALEIVHNKRVW